MVCHSRHWSRQILLSCEKLLSIVYTLNFLIHGCPWVCHIIKYKVGHEKPVWVTYHRLYIQCCKHSHQTHDNAIMEYMKQADTTFPILLISNYFSNTSYIKLLIFFSIQIFNIISFSVLPSGQVPQIPTPKPNPSSQAWQQWWVSVNHFCNTRPEV